MLPCSKRFCHDWTVCPYSHPGEKAKRRDPRLFSYTGIACPNMKKVSTHAAGVFIAWKAFLCATRAVLHAATSYGDTLLGVSYFHGVSQHPQEHVISWHVMA